MAGITTILYRSCRLEGDMPMTVLPRTLRPATIAFPFQESKFTW